MGTWRESRAARHAQRLARPIVSLVLIGLILGTVPIGSLLDVLVEADFRLVLAAGLLFVAVNCLVSYKWQCLLAAQGHPVHYGQALRAYLTGLFFGSFLPSGFGGDVVRAVEISRATKSRTSGAVSVGLDRAHSLWSLLVVAAPACLIGSGELGLPPFVGLLILALTVVSTAGGLALLFLSAKSVESAGDGVRDRYFLARQRRRAVIVVSGLGSHPKAVIWASSIAIVAQVLGFLMQYLLFTSLRVSVSPAALITVITLSTLACILPISINGIGLREGIYIALLASTGVGPSIAASLSILSHLVVASNSVLGGIVYLIGTRRPARREMLENRLPG